MIIPPNAPVRSERPPPDYELPALVPATPEVGGRITPRPPAIDPRTVVPRRGPPRVN